MRQKLFCPYFYTLIIILPPACYPTNRKRAFRALNCGKRACSQIRAENALNRAFLAFGDSFKTIFQVHLLALLRIARFTTLYFQTFCPFSAEAMGLNYRACHTSITYLIIINSIMQEEKLWKTILIPFQQTAFYLKTLCNI